MPQSVKFQIIKIITLQGPRHHLPRQCFYLIFWRYSVLYHISLFLKKVNGFLMGKHSIFKIMKISKILKFCSLKDFFNFFQVITFDRFILINWNFLHLLYTENTTYRKAKKWTVIRHFKSVKFYHKIWEKIKIIWP